MDERLAAIAAQHGGFFTRAEALDSGWNDRELAGAVRQGLLRHIRHGAYSPADIFDAADPMAQHLIVARAAVARQGGDVALTGISAAAAHGLTVYGHDLSRVHLVRLDGGSSRTRASTRHQVVGDRLIDDVQTVGDLRVVGVARAVWEVATTSSLESAVCTADSALRLFPKIPDGLAELAGVFTHRPGSRVGRMALKLADGRAQTAGESLSRVLFFQHGLPTPDLQFCVRDASGREIGITDFGWELYRHVGEFDGKIKYGRLLRPGQDPGDAVFSEKRREDQIRAELLGMSRWVWVELMPTHARDLVRRVGSDLERSQRLYTRNRTVIA